MEGWDERLRPLNPDWDVTVISATQICSWVVSKPVSGIQVQ